MSSFETVLDQFHCKRVLVVGDIMLDRFVYGHVSRISPEAPAPVLETAGPTDVVGGSGNVVRNIVSLGAACDIVAVIGSDDAAQSIRGHLGSSNVSTDGLIEVEIFSARNWWKRDADEVVQIVKQRFQTAV